VSGFYADPDRPRDGLTFSRSPPVQDKRTSLALGVGTGKGAEHKAKWSFDGL